MHGQPTARGPNPARKGFLSGPQRPIMKIIYFKEVRRKKSPKIRLILTNSFSCYHCYFDRLLNIAGTRKHRFIKTIKKVAE